jgi:PAS domain-containing protein
MWLQACQSRRIRVPVVGWQTLIALLGALCAGPSAAATPDDWRAQGWLWIVLAGSLLALAGLVFFLLRLRGSRTALQNQTRILRSVLDGIGDAVLVVDRHADLLLMNPAAERVGGSGMTTGRGGNWSRRFALYLDDHATLCPPQQLPLVRALRGEAVDHVDLYLRRHDEPPDGGHWYTVTARPLLDDAGGVRGAVAVFADTTVRRRAEDEVRALAASLEQRVRERTEDTRPRRRRTPRASSSPT